MLTFIVNPTAGSGHALRVADQISKALEKQDIAWEILYTTKPGHATQLAAEAAKRHESQGVVAVGGDGTAYEVACGLMGTGIPLGIIPAGTGNDFVKTVGIPTKPLDALRFILASKPRSVDIGRLNERMFLNVCGTGFDVTVLDYALAAKRYIRGILPYLIGLFRAIFHYRPVHLRLTVDNDIRECDALICSVANGRYIGGGIPICPEAQPDDALLDVVLVRNRPKWQIPFYLPGLLMGKITKFNVTDHLQCKTVSMVSDGMRLNVDGEIFSLNRADFAIMPGELLLYW